MNGVRVKRLKTLWPITSTMYLLKKSLGRSLPKSIQDIASLFSVGPYLSNLLKELQKEKYEAIHVTAFPFALVWQVWKACKILEKPFICTPLIHYEDPNHKNPLLWKALDDAASVIACSNYEREGMIRMGINPSRIHLIPMGIDLDEWVNSDGERFREKYRLEGKKDHPFCGNKRL